MEILELTIPSTNIEGQRLLFSQTLGFQVEMISSDQIAVSCGNTKLRFVQSEIQCLFHYCFLIPPGCLPSVISFLDHREFEALHYAGKRAVDFGNGKSVYFYDADGNIAEFIERPSLGIHAQTKFAISDVVCVNEIGIPSSNPIDYAQQLIRTFGIQPMADGIWREDFVWCGDFQGVFLITKLGRNWMPTERPAQYNPVRVKFRTNQGVFDICFGEDSFATAPAL